MTRRGRLVIAAIAAIFGLAGCTTAPSGMVVAGTVDDRVETVAAPTLSVPTVNLDAGFGAITGQTNPVTGRTANTTSNVAGALGLGSMLQIASVTVAAGDTVRAGQVLASVDEGALTVQVATAKADAAVATAQVGLLGAAIDDTYDKAKEVADNKKKVSAAIDQLNSAKGQMIKGRAQARKTRPQLVTKLHEAEKLLANYPPVPGIPTKEAEALQAAIAQLKAGIKKIDAGLAKIKTALPKLSKGLDKAQDGLKKLNDAATKIADARAQLRYLQELARIGAATSKVPVDLAKVQLALTELTSPVDGVVVSIAAVGDQLAPGATVATVRESVPSKVTAWLSPAQLSQVCHADPARIAGDWMPSGESVDATVTRIGTTADYPPTSVSSDEVHLTRAVEVEFTATEQLSAGLPVQLSIDSCRPAANQSDTNR